MIRFAIVIAILFGLFLLFVDMNNKAVKYETPEIIIWTVEEK